MLHLLVPKAQQRPQVRAVVVPILLGDLGEVERDEFLIVAKQMDIAEGTNMVERLLVLRLQEHQGLGPHPRVRDHAGGGVKTPVAENLVDGPRDFLRRRHDGRVVCASGERIGCRRHQ